MSCVYYHILYIYIQQIGVRVNMKELLSSASLAVGTLNEDVLIPTTSGRNVCKIIQLFSCKWDERGSFPHVYVSVKVKGVGKVMQYLQQFLLP